MLKKNFVDSFAKNWLEDWNSHDLERILSHYAEDVVIISPVAAKLLGSAEVRGKVALRDYFAKGLAAYPDLRFELIDILVGIKSIVLYYRNQKGTLAGEYMELDNDGRVVHMFAHYGMS